MYSFCLSRATFKLCPFLDKLRDAIKFLHIDFGVYLDCKMAGLSRPALYRKDQIRGFFFLLLFLSSPHFVNYFSYFMELLYPSEVKVVTNFEVLICIRWGWAIHLMGSLLPLP